MNFPNPIWVTGEIETGGFFVDFTRRLSVIMSETKRGDDVTLFINSAGGDMHTSLGIYDLIRGCMRSVIGIVSGRAESGASLVLQACRRRIMTSNSMLMLHKSKITLTRISVSDGQKALDVFRNLDQRFYEIYNERSGKKFDAGSGDFHFTAEEALNYGLIDGILSVLPVRLYR